MANFTVIVQGRLITECPCYYSYGYQVMASSPSDALEQGMKAWRKMNPTHDFVEARVIYVG